MQRLKHLAWIGIMVTAAAHADKPQIQWDPNYDFAAVTSFQWQAGAGNIIATANPALHAHIVNAIEYQLTSRGLIEVEADADVNVSYYGLLDRDLRVDVDGPVYAIGGYGMGNWGSYGYGRAGPVPNARAVDVTRGTLMVDIWDAATETLVWRGVVNDIQVAGNPDKTRRNAEKAIDEMAKQYQRLRDD